MANKGTADYLQQTYPVLFNNWGSYIEMIHLDYGVDGLFSLCKKCKAAVIKKQLGLNYYHMYGFPFDDFIMSIKCKTDFTL